ncbi:hypothetical protein [Carboxylicivirga linearis]|uniref:Lipoprotein n=1 Tax=Carboxylicivirga linearis TaxID=1628157 RepID=A0ABS5JXG6_9BACT|nr:hypothetical protein [Carboxylicivirga linearis]MBS2099615.1 hypothetical protein [Carboxylicivirga linearis]
MKNILAFTLFFLILSSCSDSNPKVVYNDQLDTMSNQIIIDTLAIKVAGLPIHFDSTEYLIYPIGEYKPKTNGRKVFMSSYSSSSSGAAFFYKSKNSVSGDLNNLKFQHIDSIGFSQLTTNQLKIREFSFLGKRRTSCDVQVLIYRVTDKDTNRDLKLDDDDIESLYISDVNGLNFIKLTPEFEELIDWELIKIQSRIYFITSEDIDKNGEFTKSDMLHYYYVDLNKDSRIVVEYNPI